MPPGGSRCQLRLRRHPPLPPVYTYLSRTGIDSEGVRRAMRVCGYTEVSRPFDNMLQNDIAAAELCMVDQQFTYARPASRLVCKSRPGLPAWRGRAIDARRCCTQAQAAGAR